ncbi:MAG: amidase [Hyphomicrobiales bacterium]
MAFVEDTANAFVDYENVEVDHAASGPLAGLTMGVKDLFDVIGYPTGCGHPLKRQESEPRDRTAPAVQALLDAGARFVGKTHMDELAFSLNGQNKHYGTPLNPAAPERIPGGSSSGSASAVAAGLVDFAVGSDTGGSVRAPASYCGIIGLRPTQGRISLQGAMALAPSFDTFGWFARDIDTFARVGDVLLGEDRAPLPQSVRAILAEEGVGHLASAEAKRAFVPALGAVEKVTGPMEAETIAEEGLTTWYWTFRIIQAFEALGVHGSWLSCRNPDLAPDVADRFNFGRRIREVQADGATEKRKEVRDRIGALIGSDGVIVLPTVPGIAPLLTTPAPALEGFRTRALELLCVAGLCGLPQLTLPLAEVDGAPLGISLIGPAWSDRSLIELGRRIMAG